MIFLVVAEYSSMEARESIVCFFEFRDHAEMFVKEIRQYNESAPKYGAKEFTLWALEHPAGAEFMADSFKIIPVEPGDASDYIQKRGVDETKEPSKEVDGEYPPPGNPPR